MNYHLILPQLLVGSCPQDAGDIELLKQEGVTAILSLQTDSDWDWLRLEGSRLRAWCEAAGILFRRAPVRDLDPEDLRAKLRDCARALDELLAAGHRVYLHCTAGAGRSPSVAIAWMVWRLGWSLQQAYAWVLERRACSPDLQAIEAALQDHPTL